VLIISVDGLRPDALAQAETPVLDGLRRQGMYTAEARTVVPSVTLIGHASMLGGLGPDKHGIFWNIDNAGLGKIKGPTLFSVASQAGLSAVMVVGKPRLEDIVLPGSVETFDYAGYTDQQVVEAAMPWLVGKLPAILFIHLPDVDSAGHASGWMSAEQLLTISQTDQRLGQMVEALAGQGYLSQTLLLITSDHGGANQAHGQDTAEDTTIPWLAVGPGVPHNGVITADVIIYDTAATALYALDLPRPAGWDGQPILEIFDKRACQP
jgi:predicted AlkP superfamily pyrophosphatase or phosphodiesterase